jgi:hypothetical protein
MKRDIPTQLFLHSVWAFIIKHRVVSARRRPLSCKKDILVVTHQIVSKWASLRCRPTRWWIQQTLSLLANSRRLFGKPGSSLVATLAEGYLQSLVLNIVENALQPSPG